MNIDQPTNQEQLIKANYCILEEHLHKEVNAAPGHTEAYNKVVLAYRVLADPDRKRVYDDLVCQDFKSDEWVFDK